MKDRVLGIMGAMPEEVYGIVGLMTGIQEYSIGMRTYYTGKIKGIQTVLVFSRWGKVAAATTVSTLLHKFDVTEILFTGVAGAVNEKLKIGDVVIGQKLIQHDMDGRPLMKEFELPLLNISSVEIKKEQLEKASRAVSALLEYSSLTKMIEPEKLEKFHIIRPEMYIGTIASGDKFFSDSNEKGELLKKLPDALCVEMEGAAVAQVCYEYDIPFTIIRTISDTADEHSSIDFPAFIKTISSIYSVGIITNILG